MKALIAVAAAATVLSLGAVATPTLAGPYGHHHHYWGHHHGAGGWFWHGRRWHHRSWICVRRHHTRTCYWRYW